MTKVKSKHEQWVEDINEANGVMGGIKLSLWELGFIESIQGKLEGGHTLTEKQAETLEKIWDRI